MLPWYSVGSAQMANNLIKWWRTKFLNGYKQFSVNATECGDGGLSDTEELLGRSNSSCNFVDARESSMANCSTPPPPPPASDSDVSQPPPTPNSNKGHLNLEEFSCDVSMEGGIDEDGQERQEFSFTLYDFDGHGKITKDDIAGLVTTIYETLGSSVKVPHYGSKTIKVKLTVSPDQRKHMSATVIDHKSSRTKSCDKQESNKVHVKQDLNVIIRDSGKQKEQLRKQKVLNEDHYCCNLVCQENTETFEVSDEEIDCSINCSRLSYEDMSEDEGECSEDQIPKHPSCEKIRPRRYQKYSSPRYQKHNAQNLQNAHVSISPVLCTRARRNKKRSSSLQRQELLEIIQANMDKNNLSFQTTSRKQCPNQCAISSDLPRFSPDERKHRHRQKINQNSTIQLQCLANMMSSNNYYVDLSTLQSAGLTKDNHTTHINVPYCRYDKLLDAVVCMSNKHIETGLFERSPVSRPECRSRRHYRSKSHDLMQLPFRYHLLETKNNISSKHNHLTGGLVENQKSVKKQHDKSKSYEPELEQSQTAFKKNVKKFPQVVFGHSSSPHHLKHRNRQEDQARAMAQVVHWLEQEFSSNVNTKSKPESKHSKPKLCTSPGKQFTPTQEASSPSLSGVERHEHHHVHEHIHHHYHHYQETPVVV